MYFDIHWDHVRFADMQTLLLEDVTLTGPGIQQSYKLQDKDYIQLDMTKQFSPIIGSHYIALFMWQGVEYNARGVHVKSCMLRDANVKVSQRMFPDDFIRVYLTGHDEQSHVRNVVYFAELRDENGELKRNAR